MLTPDISNAKSHCLQIYNFLEEGLKLAQHEIKTITNGEIDYDNVIVVCNKTLNFACDVIDKLTEYADSIEIDLEKIIRTSSVENAEIEHKRNPKKSRFRLRKQEDEELTQDGPLESNMCNVKENLNHSCQNSTFANILNINDNSNIDSSKKDESENGESDNSSKNEDSNESDISSLLEEKESTKYINEIDILNKIGYDTSDFESEPDSIFSVSTYILENQGHQELNDITDDDPKNDLMLEYCTRVLSDDERQNLDDDVSKRKNEDKKQNDEKSSIGSTDESCSSSIADSEIIVEEEQENRTTIGNKSENCDKFIDFLLNCMNDISKFHVDGSSENDDSKTDADEDAEIKIKEEKLEKDNEQVANDEVDDEEHFSEDLSESKDLNEEIRRKRKREREKLNPKRSGDSSTKENGDFDQKRRKLGISSVPLEQSPCTKSNDVNDNNLQDFPTIDLCSWDSLSSDAEL